MDQIEALLVLEKAGELPANKQKALDTLRAAGQVPPKEGAADMVKNAKFEGPGLIENIREEATQGIKQMFNPSSTPFLGSEALSNLPVVGDVPRNFLSSLLGGTRALYSLPNAVAKTAIGDPLRERGYDTAANIAEGVGGFGLSMLGGGIPYIGKAAQLLGMGGKVPAALEMGLAGSSRLPIRILGKMLDPLASTAPGLLQKSKAKLDARKLEMAGLERQIAAGEAKVAGLEPKLGAAKGILSDVEDKLAELKLAATESKEAKLAQTTRIIAQPEAPKIAAIPGAAAATDAGEIFKGTVLPGAREALYGESSARYKALEEIGKKIPLTEEDIKPILTTMQKLGDEVRLTPATKGVTQALDLETATAKNIAREVGGEVSHIPKEITISTFRQIDPREIEALAAKGLTANDIFKTIREGVGTPEATVSDAMRAEQILSAAARGYGESGNIAARAAVNELKVPISAIIEASPVAEGLAVAKSLHRGTSELVGPKSLAERVFRVKPEQVIDNIFLPQGASRPNLSMIEDAKAIYEKVAPGEWPKVVGGALAKLQERSIGPAGQITPQKFLQQWRQYRGTFEKALDPASFNAVDEIAKGVTRYNAQSAVSRQAIQLATKEGAAMREFYARQAAQLQTQMARTGVQRSKALQGVNELVDKIKDGNKDVEHLKNLLEQDKTFGLKNRIGSVAMEVAMSPHLMIAFAQLGQAAQAAITGNWVGVSRQLMQGLIWATLGNPLWLERIAQNPAIAKTVETALKIQKGSHATIEAQRLLLAATKAVGDTLYEESGPTQ